MRTSGDRDDPGGHRRLAAIEGWVYTGHVEQKRRRSISYTLNPLFQYLIHRNIHDCGLFTEI